MKFGPVLLEAALGHILGHNMAGADGRRLLRKGKPLTTSDLEALRALGHTSVYVAELTPDDLDEDTAARRVAEGLLGGGVRLSGPASGRVNFLATTLGVLRVEVERLAQVNELEGLTLATLLTHTPVRPRQIIATIKVIPFAVPMAVVQAVEHIAANGARMVRVDELPPRAVGLIFSGSPSIREKLMNDFAPLRERLEALGSRIALTDYIPLEDEAGEARLAETVARFQAQAELIVIAGETAIMDRQDIVPRAVERAGGRVACLGAPVDPGNLLMLAYIGATPILGAPGCARSRKTNIVDWVLPRLLAGDQLSRADIIALGHGGLLEEAPERPMPRDVI